MQLKNFLFAELLFMFSFQSEKIKIRLKFFKLAKTLFTSKIRSVMFRTLGEDVLMLSDSFLHAELVLVKFSLCKKKY